ncbi:FAD/NAD(P)-binding domain-containing protein [Aulographum hederae CBS 113979]|uniref:FAD/NAD(P)-binding domain-containing protein n=1 Tax=Aulographum hederae CBS 113979 TaxID=1176131 RepID=A0A6G1GYB7_9PEZI|nr:FAD/NAD(P)-binding domain-containing protein [Aulographum hederae CBS 113979]
MAMQDMLVHFLTHPITFLYQVLEWLLDKIFSPTPPPPNKSLTGPKIAIIGAGLTGVSAASHCVGHGFEATIFEAGDRKALGGIWAKVNNTSGLQIHSIMYRFHPSLKWSKGYPDRRQIVSQITDLWERYDLEPRTRFNTHVTKVYKDDKDHWIINDPSNGHFDAVIAAIGTCGDPKVPHLPGQDKFKGEIYHSSELDGKSAKGKKVAVIGGGASAIEALEFVASENAEHTNVLARSEKWIIPRNPFVDALLAMNVLGSETVFSWIPETLLRKFFYRDLKSLAPPPGSSKGLFTETPMVNNDVLELIRDEKASWLRGDILGYTENGIKFNHRSQGVPKGGPGRESNVEADMVILATGYQRPTLSFLPDDCFQEPYEPPNWYLQVFPPAHMDICCNNCTYVNAIGTVGSYHIGIYTRFLLMYLVDPLARPREWWMKRWIDMTRTIKSKAPGGAFDFFTYSELIYWFIFTIAINPFRWKWAAFVLFGFGSSLPMSIVEREDRIRDGIGMQNGTGMKKVK